MCSIKVAFNGGCADWACGKDWYTDAQLVQCMSQGHQQEVRTEEAQKHGVRGSGHHYIVVTGKFPEVRMRRDAVATRTSPCGFVTKRIPYVTVTKMFTFSKLAKPFADVMVTRTFSCGMVTRTYTDTMLTKALPRMHQRRGGGKGGGL